MSQVAPSSHGPPPTGPSGRELVKGIRARDAAAEAELVQRYRRPIRAVLRQRLRDPADVDDFVQEALSLGLVKIRGGELREPDRLGSYLIGLARNLVSEHFRRLARRKTEADPQAIAQHPAVTASPDRQLVDSERAQLVRRLMDELETPRDRDILCRFYLREEDKESICKDLGLSSLHFNRVLHRARQRYRRLYEQHDHVDARGGPADRAKGGRAAVGPLP
ncbi:MAG: sigma-70 family RNA polymerase sigma factor [Acidobacteriota bacterium]